MFMNDVIAFSRIVIVSYYLWSRPRAAANCFQSTGILALTQAIEYSELVGIEINVTRHTNKQLVLCFCKKKKNPLISYLDFFKKQHVQNQWPFLCFSLSQIKIIYVWSYKRNWFVYKCKNKKRKHLILVFAGVGLFDLWKILRFPFLHYDR